MCNAWLTTGCPRMADRRLSQRRIAKVRGLKTVRENEDYGRERRGFYDDVTPGSSRTDTVVQIPSK